MSDTTSIRIGCASSGIGSKTCDIGNVADGTFWRASGWSLGQKTRMVTRNIGMVLLAIYLILVGINTLFHVGVGAIVMGVLALVAGILILVGK